MTDEKTWLERRREALAPRPQVATDMDTCVMATIESQAETEAPQGDQPLGQSGEGEDETGVLIGDPEAIADALLTVLNEEGECES